MFRTQLQLPDYRLDTWGADFTARNRVEFSAARQRLDLGALGRAIGMPAAALKQNVFGAKARLVGDLVYGNVPQISMGVQYKRDLGFAIPRMVGACRASSTDVYLTVTRLTLAGLAGYDLLWNLIVRSSNANQFGLLGFGGDRGNRQLLLEGSLAMLFNPQWAVGMEYREKPDHLAFARANAATDAFVGYFPNKRVAVVASYADLGSIGGLTHQRGAYLSVQGSL